jgi:serine/threonine-protein kinase
VAPTAVSNSPTQEWTKEDVQAIREGSAVKEFSQEPQNVSAYADSQRNSQYGNQANNNPYANPYGAQYGNQPIQNNMGELKSNNSSYNIPVNNERINQLFQEEEIPWEDEEETVVIPPQKHNGGIKKVQDYDDDYDDYDYDNDGDGDLDPKLKKGVMIAGIASAVIIAIIILVLLGNLAGWFKFGSKNDTTDTESSTDTSTSEETQVEEVDMISVVGYAQDKAVELLGKLGLTNVTVQTEENTEVQEGYVFDQSVKENTRIKTDFEVILKVASAAEQVDIPDVTNYTDQQAKTVLEEAGFTVAHSYEYSEEIETDKVIRTEPEAGTKADKGSKVIGYE